MSVASPAIQSGAGRRRLIRGGLITLALLYVFVLLVAPLGGIIWAGLKDGVDVVRETFLLADVQNAFRLTLLITVITVVVTTVLGVLVAYVLARHQFPGRRLLNAFVDLPLAVSPVTVGLAAVLLFGRGGWFEPFFAARGIEIIFAVPSMVLVTMFICVPFVIREVGPLLEELGTEEEEAARTLGASSFQAFFRITLPNIKWGALYGGALAAARSLGEIGAVLIVSGSLQGQKETATMYIFRAFEERQDAAGNIVALSLAAISVILLVGIEFFKQHREREAKE